MLVYALWIHSNWMLCTSFPQIAIYEMQIYEWKSHTPLFSQKKVWIIVIINTKFFLWNIPIFFYSPKSTPNILHDKPIETRQDSGEQYSHLTALETAQIRSGFTNPIFEDTSLPIVYEIDSDLISLRERIRAMGGSLWIEEEWTPSLQRVNDVSIMEAFIRSGMFTKHELITANRVRIWMRIVSIADITDPSGRFIPDDVLNGEFRAGSDLRWPNSATPTRRQFSTFRRMIHQTFCPKVPKYQRASYSLEFTTL